ncbi:hypothetical protein DFH07DRAFT_803866 [Mycena maculata]|uniref:Uncharacterized protein n=1 Tax=Mycena maculata TaxID=230809 RepID=A0AAD7NR60_9AGAR|nr:hypothetical protein DFH07DRAFT_803866 [Mycena maculata]
MDATALSNLPRSEIVSLAKANKIKANLSTKEIIRLLLCFPEGVPLATSSTSAPRTFVGLVKDAFKTLTASPKVDDTPSETTSQEAGRTALEIPPQTENSVSSVAPLPRLLPENPVGNTTFSGVPAVPSEPLPPTPSIVESHTETVAADGPGNANDDWPSDGPDPLAPADPEDISLLVADMAAISARNKVYKEKAAAMRAQAKKLREDAVDMRTMLTVEASRRERMETYLKYWRAMDTEWSYPAVWDGEVTFAPVLARFDGVKGSVMMEMEVTTSDDEELVKQWHNHDDAFRKRRKTIKGDKAKQRGVDVEMVSEDEPGSDEEEFYSPFVLRPENDDGTVPDSDCYVYPFMELSETTTPGIMFVRDEEVIIRDGVNISGRPPKRVLDDIPPFESFDGARYSPRARVEQEDKGNEPEEDYFAAWLKRERMIAETLGVAMDDNWEGLGTYCAGWRMGDS